MTIQWTPEMDAELAAMYAQGRPSAEIAERFGIAASTVGLKVKRLGLARRPRINGVIWTPEMDAALVEQRSLGRGYEIIGEHIGVCNTIVKRRVKALGLPNWDRGGGRRSDNVVRLPS